MRDVALLAIIIFGLIATLRYPYVGILLWTWVTMMVPHQLAFGFSRSFPINLLVAVVTVLAWIFSKERKQPTFDATFILVCLFLVWITINGFAAVDPAGSWPLWDRTWRIIVLGLLVSITANSRVRIHALIMVIVLSLLYFGVKGGLFTLTTGGHFSVVGPPASMIGDNNQLALALVMVLPLANYLRLHAASLIVRRLLFGGMVLTFFSIVGSYSRGGFLALGALVVVSAVRAKSKWLYPLVAAAVVFSAIQFMPQEYFSRISTIKTAQSDASFQGREDAWHVAYGYAKDHFPFGAGFSGPEQPQVFNKYEPGKDTHAAHSIFFQVLGDNGFAGLAIYLLILTAVFWNTIVIRHKTKKVADFLWAYDLAGMLQLTLVAFCVGGSGLSFAYYDLLFISAGVLSAMRVLVGQRTVANRTTSVNDTENIYAGITSGRASQRDSVAFVGNHQQLL